MWVIEPAAYPVTGAFPCTAPTLWPERLSADWSWSPWRSKWNHMGEPDSGTWPEEKLTWAVQREAPGLWDGWSPPQSLPLQHILKQSYTISSHNVIMHACKWTVCTLDGMLNGCFPSLASMCIPHPCYILSGVFCGRSGLRSGRPIRSIYCRASRHANNTKHTNGRETKPQATDIQ